MNGRFCVLALMMSAALAGGAFGHGEAAKEIPPTIGRLLKAHQQSPRNLSVIKRISL